MRPVPYGTSLGFARALVASGLFVAFTAFIASSPVSAQEKSPPPITISGTVETNYTYNFNKPANGSNVFLYNTNEGQFSLNLADLRVGRAATPDSRIGFMIRPVAGEVARRNFNAGDHIGGPNLAILEGYGTLLVPIGGKDLKVDAGQFVTHVGYETIEIGTNNFFSRNWLFQFPSPFYDAGLRAALPVSSKMTVSGYLYNRYNGTFDPGNRDIAPGFQIAYVPSAKTSIVLNGLHSLENLAYDGTSTTTVVNKRQSVLDLVVSHQLSPSLKLVGEGLWRWGKNLDINTAVIPPILDDSLAQAQTVETTYSSKSYNVGGGAGYLIYTLKNGNTLGLRGEYVSPLPNLGTLGAATPGLMSATATYELRSGLFPGSRTMFEVRYDNAGQNFFFGKNYNATATPDKKSQTTFTIGQIFNF